MYRLERESGNVNMLSFLSKQSIKKQLLLIPVLLILSFLTLYYYGFYKIARFHYNDNIEILDNEINKLQGNILSQIEILSNLISGISYNPITQKFLQATDQLERYNLFLDLDSNISNFQDLTPGIEEIIIVSPRGNNYAYYSEYRKDIEEFIPTIPKVDRGWYSGRKTIPFDNIPVECIFAGSQIYNIDRDVSETEILGQIVVVLNIEEFLLSNDTVHRLYLVGDDNAVISSPRSEPRADYMNLREKIALDSRDFSLGQVFSRREKVLFREIPPMKAYIAGVITERELFSNFSKVIGTNTVFLLVITLLISLLYFLIISNIIVTHNKISQFIRGIKWEDFEGEKEPVRIFGYSEAEELGDNLNKMIRKIRNLTQGLIKANREILDLELTTKKAELSYLINQINPHFLYNTLESINGIAAGKNIPEIQDVTRNLGEMFQYSLIKSEIVTVKEEIDLIKSYLKIQTLRFQDRFSTKLEVPEKYMGNSIPKMILQPIVENAIVHGLELKTSGGLLTISAEETANRCLKVTVEDNGPGMSPGRREEIQYQLDHMIECDESRVGLINVHKRLRLHFGEPFGLSISSDKDSGTGVFILLPLREK